eukprot:2697564-Amphidinium_carterae.1
MLIQWQELRQNAVSLRALLAEAAAKVEDVHGKDVSSSSQDERPSDRHLMVAEGTKRKCTAIRLCNQRSKYNPLEGIDWM